MENNLNKNNHSYQNQLIHYSNNIVNKINNNNISFITKNYFERSFEEKYLIFIENNNEKINFFFLVGFFLFFIILSCANIFIINFIIFCIKINNFSLLNNSFLLENDFRKNINYSNRTELVDLNINKKNIDCVLFLIKTKGKSILNFFYKKNNVFVSLFIFEQKQFKFFNFIFENRYKKNLFLKEIPYLEGKTNFSNPSIVLKNNALISNNNKTIFNFCNSNINSKIKGLPDNNFNYELSICQSSIMKNSTYSPIFNSKNNIYFNLYKFDKNFLLMSKNFKFNCQYLKLFRIYMENNKLELSKIILLNVLPYFLKSNNNKAININYSFNKCLNFNNKNISVYKKYYNNRFVLNNESFVDNNCNSIINLEQRNNSQIESLDLNVSNIQYTSDSLDNSLILQYIQILEKTDVDNQLQQYRQDPIPDYQLYLYQKYDKALNIKL